MQSSAGVETRNLCVGLHFSDHLSQIGFLLALADEKLQLYVALYSKES